MTTQNYRGTCFALAATLLLGLLATGSSQAAPSGRHSFITASAPSKVWPMPSYNHMGWAHSKGSFVPAMPSSLPGYQKAGRVRRQTIRAFDTMWNTGYKFPATMNGCNQRVYTIRWRSLNLKVSSALVSAPDEFRLEIGPKPAIAGYMLTYRCGQPSFAVPRVHSGDSTLTDVEVEYQAWIPKI